MLLVQVCSASNVRRYREVGGPGIEDNSEEFVLALPTVSHGIPRQGLVWGEQRGGVRSEGCLKQVGGRLGD